MCRKVLLTWLCASLLVFSSVSMAADEDQIVIWRGESARAFTHHGPPFATVDRTMRSMLEEATTTLKILLPEDWIKEIRTAGGVEAIYKVPKRIVVRGNALEISRILIPLNGRLAESSNSTLIIFGTPDYKLFNQVVLLRSADKLKKQLRDLSNAVQ